MLARPAGITLQLLTRLGGIQLKPDEITNNLNLMCESADQKNNGVAEITGSRKFGAIRVLIKP